MNFATTLKGMPKYIERDKPTGLIIRVMNDTNHYKHI